MIFAIYIMKKKKKRFGATFAWCPSDVAIFLIIWKAIIS